MLTDPLYFRSYFDSDGTLEFIRSLGADPHALADEVGLKFPPYDTKVQFSSWSAMCTLLEILVERYNEPSAGIKLAFTIPNDFRNSGPTLFLASITSDMRRFLNMAIEYQKIHTNGVSYSYEEDTQSNRVTGIISLHPYSPPSRQICEYIMTAIMMLTRQIIPNVEPMRVTFQHDRPDDISWHEKAFGCEMEFNADRYSITLDRNVLNLMPKAKLSKITAPLLKTYFNFNVGKNPKSKTPVSLLVSETLPNIIGIKNSDIQTVASALNMHPKKLQRLLNDEGTSYSALLDDVRRSIAERILTESNMPINRLAKILDYSSDRPLSIATKRWFGMSPTQFRKHSKQGGGGDDGGGA